jgi:hypothetical protein
MSKLIVATIKPTGEITMKEFTTVPPYEYLRDQVEGYIETIPYFTHLSASTERYPAVAFCNEEGKLNGLSPNQLATQMWYKTLAEQNKPPFDYLCGNIVIIYGDKSLLDQL